MSSNGPSIRRESGEKSYNSSAPKYTSSDIGRQRNSFLDIVKLTTAVFVVISHFSWTEMQKLSWWFPLWDDFVMCVPMFMLITGYVNAVSFSRRFVVTFYGFYSAKNILNKIITFTVPFLFVFIVSVIGRMILGKGDGFGAIVQAFFWGGYGPGAYYIPCLIQLIFIFPVIYRIIADKKENGLVICFFINLVFEVAKTVYDMNADCYRLLVFRYFFIVALGCYTFLYREKLSYKKALLCGAVGTCYLLLNRYTGYRPIVFTYWNSTCMVSALFAFPFLYWVTAPSNKVRFKCGWMEYAGKRSYYIFLVQMLFYSSDIDKTILSVVKYPIIAIVINIAVCVLGGLAFSMICAPVVDRVKSFLPCLRSQGRKN